MSAPEAGVGVEWLDWGPRAFDRARAEGRPVLLNLRWTASRLSQNQDEVLSTGEPAAVIRSRYVPVRVVAEDRPDVAARLAAPDLGPSVLSVYGELLSRPPCGSAAELARGLESAASSYDPNAHRRGPGAHGPVWTGATTLAAFAPPATAEWATRALAAVDARHAADLPCPDCLDVLLYGAAELGHEKLAESARFNFARLLRHDGWDPKTGAFARRDELPRLDLNARLCRLLWDVHAWSGEPESRERASKVAAFLLQRLYNHIAGAFRFVPEGAHPVYYADANAMAALALLRAAAFESHEYPEAASHTLVFLGKLNDARRGVAHISDHAPAGWGLLADSAWAMLAFTEGFFVTGLRGHRESADAILKFLFQDLWERETGGFLDREPDDPEAGPVGASLMPAALNAVAMEAVWRLANLKGNVHYLDWAKLGLARLAASPQGCGAGLLARAADIFTRGRVDLELVGRIGEPKTGSLLWALQRHYVPRRIISFVDPDDQDYILAHKIAVKSWPRIFGCVDLNPKAEAGAPEEVAALLQALRG